jgi:hypothetical protein
MPSGDPTVQRDRAGADEVSPTPKQSYASATLMPETLEGAHAQRKERGTTEATQQLGVVACDGFLIPSSTKWGEGREGAFAATRRRSA